MEIQDKLSEMGALSLDFYKVGLALYATVRCYSTFTTGMILDRSVLTYLVLHLCCLEIHFYKVS